MTETADKRADTSRREILRAAAHQFAQRPYHDVGLGDVLAEAGLTKGTMYFHFRSKHDLALAVIESQTRKDVAAVQGLLKRRLSGLETLIDITYQSAVDDLCEDVARARLHLLEAVGRTDGLQARLAQQGAELLTPIAARAIAEGDVRADCDPADVGRLLLTLHAGTRRISSLDRPEQFLLDVEKALVLLLPAIVPPDRIDYFRQFITRRTAVAIRTTAPR